MAMMVSHHRMGDEGNGLDREIGYILTHKFYRYRKTQTMVTQQLDAASDEDLQQ